MSLSLIQSRKIAEDPEFQGRVGIAFNVVAHEIIVEDEVENHVLRANQANMVLQRGLEETGRQFASSVVAAPNIREKNNLDEITDELILDAVRASWNATIGIVSTHDH